LNEITGPFFVGLVVYSFLFLINLIFQLASLAIQQGLAPSVTGLLFLLSLPSILAYTTPIAVLLGTIIAFSRLSSDSEIVAIRAGGVRVASLLKAPLVLAMAACGALLVFNLWLIPAARTFSTEIQVGAGEASQLVRLLRPGVFFDRIPGAILFASSADLKTDTYRNVFIYQRGGPGEDLITCAGWARVVQSKEKGILQFIAGDGQSIHFNRKTPGRVDVSEFKEQTLTVELAGGGSPNGSSKGLSDLYPREILGKLRAESQSDDPQVRRQENYTLRYEIQRRFAGAFVALVFVLIGVPLGLVNVRGGRGAGFSLSLLIVLVYWVQLSGLADLARAGRIWPELAAWFPNLSVLALAIPLLRYRDRMTGWKAWDRVLALFPGKELEPEDVRRKSAFSSGHLTILDRYIFRRLAFFLCLILASMLLLNWVIEVRGLSEFITHGKHWKWLGTYLLNQTPSVLSLLIPLAVPLTALITFGVLDRGNEVMAMKASGVSLYRLSLPALVLAALGSLFLLGMGETVVPQASRRAQSAKERLKNMTSRNIAANVDVWIFAPDRRTLYNYAFYDTRTKTFQGFSRYRLAQGAFRIEDRFFAKRASFTGPQTLTYERGWEWRNSAQVRYRDAPEGSLVLPMPSSYFLLPPLREGQYFSSADLKKLIDNLRKKGYPTYTQRVDYFKKVSDAASPLVLLLASLPFAFSTGRKGSLHGIAIALGISIAFYLLSSVFRAVGQMQWLDPALAAWAPLVLLTLAAFYSLLNLRT
jgi:LPS export ABC transporter permease LptF/LPS export ABC transporter permease LptG